MSFLLQTFASAGPVATTTFYIAVVAILLCSILLVCVIYLFLRIRRLLGGASAGTIEQSLLAMKRDIVELKEFKNESVRYLQILEERVKRSAQAVETVRFNPFKGTGDGGNQSFSTAILNEKGDGVILSSLYSRERVSIFGKPVRGFEPQYELSDEERSTLSRAKESLAIPSIAANAKRI